MLVSAYYINLDHRTDRNIRMVRELDRIGLTALRIRGMLPDEFDLTDPKLQVMANRTKGAIGCHYSQVKAMQSALELNQHALVMEDDLVFCSDFHERMNIIESFLNKNEWDVFWLGGTYHKEPTWHKSIDGKHTHPDLQECNCLLNKDWEQTNNKHIVRTYGCWSTYAYIVNVKSISKILKLLEDNIDLSMGIDWLFILLQPDLKTFAFNPGCVKQYDNQSDIGKGVTRFSAFRKSCGEHYFKDTM